MNRFRIVADSSCDLLTLDGADFVSVPLTIRTDTEEFRDDAFLDVNEMVTVLRGTRGRSYSACPNIADWEDAFGERGDVIAFTITGSLSGSYSVACAAKKHCEELDSSRRICVVDSLSAGPEIALLIEKHGLRCAQAPTLTMCAGLSKYIVSELICSLLWNPCTTLRRMGGSASWRQPWPAFWVSVLLGKPAPKGHLRCLVNAAGIKNSEIHAARDGTAWLQGWECSNWTLSERSLCAGALQRDSASVPGSGCKSYPLRGLCSYYAERGGIMLGFES